MLTVRPFGFFQCLWEKPHFFCWVLKGKILCYHPVSGFLPSFRSDSLPIHLTWLKKGKQEREMLARRNSTSPLHCILLAPDCQRELTGSGCHCQQPHKSHRSMQDLVWVFMLYSECELVSDLLFKSFPYQVCSTNYFQSQKCKQMQELKHDSKF